MEKIKNMLHPGKSRDDEVMYGSGKNDDPVHAGTGSQATSAHNYNEQIAKDELTSSSGPSGNTARDPVGQGGMGSIQQGSNPVSASRMPDTHESPDTNKALPREPAVGGTQGYGSSTTTGAEPHSSGIVNKVDSTVESDLDGSRGPERQGVTGTSGGLTGSSVPDRTTGNTSSTADSGRSFPLGGAAAAGTTSGYGTGTGATVGSGHQGDLNRSGAEDTTGTSLLPSDGIGYSERTWTHDHSKHGHDYAGDPCADEPPAPGAPHFTAGPHSLDTANRLDPHVSGGGIASAPISLGDSSTSSTGHHHPGRDATLGAGAASAGAGAYESRREAPRSSISQSENTTAGPHKSNMMNTVDPRVDSDLSRQQGSSTTSGTTNLARGSSAEPSASREPHGGRDSTLAAGAGGMAMFKGAEHHHGRDVPEGTTSSGFGTRDQSIPQGTSTSGYANPYPPSSTAGAVGSGPSSAIGSGSTAGTSSEPHSSNLASRVDPRIDSDRDGRRGLESEIGHTGTTAGHPSSTTGTATSIDPTSGNQGHHYGRDAGIVGGVGVGAGAAYEADKHLRGPHGDTSGGRSLEPSATQQPLSRTSDPNYGRDPGLATTGSTGHHESRHAPSATGMASQQPAYDERIQPQESHTGRNAALGAGAGAAAVAGGQEFSKKEAEKEAERAHKEELKEQKAAHKEEEKVAKHHQHEVEKAEKKHQHDLEKEQKAHEKKMENEEAKHQKEEPQHGEKKHHGLLGFLHRDKPDKELKEEEAARKEREEQQAHPGAGMAATSAGGALAGTEGMSEMEKHERAKEHDRNRLHKDPPPGYADPPTKGYASQVTGGTGTTALAQGDPVPSGSHATGLGNTMDPSVASRAETVDSDRTRDSQGRMTEPHTGLPVNTSKGDGAGGTDSTPIHGFHPGQSGTDGTTTASGSGGEGFGHFQDHAR